MLEVTNFETPKRAVVLGSAGFVGSEIVKQLKNFNIPTLPLGRQEVDLLAPDASKKMIKYFKKNDVIIITSAVAPVKNYNMLNDNINMMNSICTALSSTEVNNVVYLSSDAVYSDSEGPLIESSNTQPDSLHGIMHVTRELMLKSVLSNPLSIVRPTLIYGPNDPHNGYGPNRFYRSANTSGSISLFGAGEEKRDHIFVTDVAELCCRVAVGCYSGVLNAATGNVHSFDDIADMIARVVRKEIIKEYVPRVGEMPHRGYRPFDPKLTLKIFPDFKYAVLDRGLIKMHE